MPKVLIVDDAAAVRSMLRTVLAREGYEVTGELGSGLQVLPLIEQRPPDIVCLDYNLPDTDGLSLMKEILARHPATAVVLITGSQDATLENAAAEAGASGLIRKPFSADTVIRELAQVVHAQQLLATSGNADAFAVKTARARAVTADDSATMRILLKMILSRAGVEVVGEARDGAQAVEMAVRYKPDLVCLDLEMPVMGGLEALEAIHAQLPEAKVLMITGRANREAIMHAGRLGARGYILKPYQPERVMEAVDRLLG